MHKTKRIEEVRSHLSRKDTDLGFRRLIDLGLETQNTKIFDEIFHFVDWFYSKDFQESMALEKAEPILSRIEAEKEWTRISDENPLLKITQLVKKYSAGNFTLGPIDILLNPREIIGLVGQNGNGKTTFIKSILGDLKPDEGKIVYFNNAELSPDYETRTLMAYIPQRTEIWYGSLMENLLFTAAHHGYEPNECEAFAKMYIARLGLWKFKDYKWKQLSGGYKMRFELARTLLRKPKILLLDEPLANLDIVAQQLVLEDLKLISQSDSNPMGIILSSQQLYEVEKVSSRVLFLQNGKPQIQSLEQKNNSKESSELIIELEANADHEMIQNCFKDLELLQIKFNGGAYILHFSESTHQSAVLKSIAEFDLPIHYLRNISTSSRRFFFN